MSGNSPIGLIMPDNNISLIVPEASTVTDVRKTLYNTIYKSSGKKTLDLRNVHTIDNQLDEYTTQIEELKAKVKEFTKKDEDQRAQLNIPEVKALIQSYDKLKDSSSLNIIGATIERANLKYHNFHGYEDWQYHFAATIQFLGGKRSLNFWAGKQETGKHGGNHPVEPDKMNTSLPSYSALKRKLPIPTPYKSVSDQVTEKISKFIHAYERGNGWKDANGQVPAIITFDEITIREGLLIYKDKIVGLVEKYLDLQNYENYLSSLAENDSISNHLATHVLCCFLTSLDGKASIPLFLVPTNGASGTDHVKFVNDARRELVKSQVVITLVFSDSGVSDWQGFTDGLAKEDIYLCSDVVHDIKNLIADIRTKDITLDGIEVNIKSTLWPVIKNDEALREEISDKNLFPTDAMDIRPVKLLFDMIDKALAWATENKSQPLILLCTYIINVKNWYQYFNDYHTEKNLLEKLQSLDNIAAYFQRISRTCKRDIKALIRGPESVRNIRKVYEKYKWREAKMMGYFGTNVNENLFSQVRAKSRYVTLHEVFQIVDRAYAELVKRNCLDLPYNYPDTQLSDCYNNQKCLTFMMEDIPFGKTNQEKGNKMQKKDLPKKLIDILETNHPTRRRMTIRMGTCFENPFSAARSKDEKVACPFSYQSQLQQNQKRCEQKPYSKLGCLENHLKTVHEIMEADVQTWMAKARYLSVVGESELVTDQQQDVAKVKQEVSQQLHKTMLNNVQDIRCAIESVFGDATVFIVDFETTGFEAERQGINFHPIDQQTLIISC